MFPNSSSNNNNNGNLAQMDIPMGSGSGGGWDIGGGGGGRWDPQNMPSSSTGMTLALGAQVWNDTIVGTVDWDAINQGGRGL